MLTSNRPYSTSGLRQVKVIPLFITVSIAGKTFLEAIRDIHIQYDMSDATVELQTITDLMNIHRHYTHRTEEDNDKTIKILLEKINDPEKIDWHPRFYKTLAKCDIALPLVDLVDFRYVLMYTFQGAYTEIANLKSSLRLIISGSPHSRITDIRRGEKKGGYQSKPAQSLCTVCGKFSHDSKACPAKGSPCANLTPSAFVGSAGHAKLVADKGPRNYIPGAAPVVPNNKDKAAETLPVNPTKPSTKSWANKKRGKILTSSTSTTTDTTSNFMSVTLSVLPQERTSVRMEMDALLDTGSLAGDFIAEDVIVRYNLKPVLSDTSYTVCSGLDNRCLKSNTMLLLRVTFSDEVSDRYGTFDIKAHILKATPVNLIIGRDSIKKFNLFSKVPSQLGVKLPTPKPNQPSKCTTGPCDCPLEVPLTPLWQNPEQVHSYVAY